MLVLFHCPPLLEQLRGKIQVILAWKVAFLLQFGFFVVLFWFSFFIVGDVLVLTYIYFHSVMTKCVVPLI